MSTSVEFKDGDTSSTVEGKDSPVKQTTLDLETDSKQIPVITTTTPPQAKAVEDSDSSELSSPAEKSNDTSSPVGKDEQDSSSSLKGVSDDQVMEDANSESNPDFVASSSTSLSLNSTAGTGSVELPLETFETETSESTKKMSKLSELEKDMTEVKEEEKKHVQENVPKEDVIIDAHSDNKIEESPISEPKLSGDSSSSEKRETQQVSVTDTEESLSQSSAVEEDMSLASDGANSVEKPSSSLSELTAQVQSDQLMVNLPPAKDDLTPEEVGAVAGAGPSSSTTCVYSVKWVMFNNNKVPVITQNENGPCPLIAIMNVLLLLKKIEFPALMEMVTSDQLMSYLGECIFENVPKNITEDSRLNYEQNMQDAMGVFHKLQTGLDVNVRFTGVCDFEYTPECIIFDLLEIRLYHGWLVDPQEPAVGNAVGNCSYNQLVEKIIANKSSDKQDLVTEALIAETFLESSASQLTYHGLCELSTTVKEGELCVCFRNNHFSTLHKHKGELFVLVTDQGFLTEPNVVWETLSNVEGDCHFVDANFHTYTKPELPPLAVPDVPVPAGTDQQIDQDYLVALSLQQEQQLPNEEGANWNQSSQPPPPSVPREPLSDHELAIKLQEEEDRRAAAAYQQQQQQAPSSQQPHSPGNQPSTSGGRRPKEKKDKDGCQIL